MYDNLATALLHITEAQKIPKILEESIRSISILLTDLTDRTTATDISTAIHEHLLGANRTLRPIINKLKDLTTNIKQTSSNLSETAKKLQTDNEEQHKNS